MSNNSKDIKDSEKIGADKNNVKARIVNTALKLFAEKGFENVTVDEIIENAETSKGGFYYYFKSKTDLVLYWLPRVDSKYRQWYEEQTERDCEELLRRFCRCVFRVTECDVSADMLSIVYSAQLRLQDKRKIADANRALYSIMHDIIRRGQEEGIFTDRYSYKELTRMLVTIIRGSIYDWCLRDGDSSLEEYGSRLSDSVIFSFSNRMKK